MFVAKTKAPADQLHDYRAASVRLCFPICKNDRMPHGAANIFSWERHVIHHHFSPPGVK